MRGRLESTAPPDLVYAALTDYSSLPRVFHNVLESQELDVGGEKHLVQVGGCGCWGGGCWGSGVLWVAIVSGEKHMEQASVCGRWV